MSDDIFDDLEQQLDREVEGWRPAPGDKLVGRVVEVSEITGQYEPYPLVVVATKDGREIAFHAFHTVARQEVGRQKPQVGDMIAVAFRGKVPGKDYEGYKIRVVHATLPAATAESVVPPTVGLDFDRIAAEAEAELANN